MVDDGCIGNDTGVGSDLIQPAVALPLAFDHGPLDQFKLSRKQGLRRFPCGLRLELINLPEKSCGRLQEIDEIV